LRDRHRALLVDGGGWPSGDFGGRVLLPALARLGVASPIYALWKGTEPKYAALKKKYASV